MEEIKNEEGKIVSFHCKLCECKFNDPNAREAHLAGRRHRLSYKVSQSARMNTVKSILLPYALYVLCFCNKCCLCGLTLSCELSFTVHINSY